MSLKRIIAITRPSKCFTGLSIPKMKPEMDLLSSAKKDDEGAGSNYSESLYKHAFLCGLDRSKYGIVKMLIPRDIAGSLIFKTGVEIKKQEEEETYSY